MLYGVERVEIHELKDSVLARHACHLGRADTKRTMNYQCLFHGVQRAAREQRVRGWFGPQLELHGVR
eukprot:6482031-Pyramimonas_sp.AAC.1